MIKLRNIIRNKLQEIFNQENRAIVEINDDKLFHDILLNQEKIGEVEITIKNNKYLTLHKILINEEYRGIGYGDDIMNQIIDYSNNHNLIIVLTPDSVWGSSKKKLTDWYKKLGFVLNKGKKKDFETMQLMYKLPDSISESNWPQSNMMNFIPPQYPNFPNPEDYDEFGNLINSMTR